MESKAKVTVCIATYNGEKFLKDQLDSILKQLTRADEVIISDDSSTDNTIQILRYFAKKDNRIKLFLEQGFRDPILNFQNALIHATGDYIYLSDQDDVWLDGKIEKINSCLKQHDLVIHDSIVTDESLNQMYPSFFKYFGSKKGILKNIIKSSYYGSCMAFRKQLLTEALPFPKTKEIGHDLWLGLVAELTGSVLFLKEPYLLYRRHLDTFTMRGMGGKKRTILQMARGRIIMCFEIVKFLFKKLLKKPGKQY
ncbi:glycosyltransferase family 2 protein [Leptospira jelokensis]|uniref:glycosyltransferase family 2 protein n=1 Tax=Leptospira jelokensis TaxID=2484931 RepID=UPI0010914386|nr:glycosyltransferase family 2 protein [Leptospira jelokensis]TGL99241.1 glycosyltransferase family 2 protein [Leptospira jelokensis]